LFLAIRKITQEENIPYSSLVAACTRCPIYTDIGEPATLGGLAVYLSETDPSVCIGESWDTKRPNSAPQQFPLSEVILKLAERPKLKEVVIRV
jgi:hypothetical protein